FVHDYDIDAGSYDPIIPGNEKILSFCGDMPMFVMTEQDIWSHNKKAIANYVPNGKDLKLIWETGGSRTESIIRMFQSLRDLGTEDSLSFSFGGRVRTFYVLNIPYKNIRQFQERVNALPATPETLPPPFAALPENPHNMFTGRKGTRKAEFDSPTGIAV